MPIALLLDEDEKITANRYMTKNVIAGKRAKEKKKKKFGTLFMVYTVFLSHDFYFRLFLDLLSVWIVQYCLIIFHYVGGSGSVTFYSWFMYGVNIIFIERLTMTSTLSAEEIEHLRAYVPEPVLYKV